MYASLRSHLLASFVGYGDAPANVSPLIFNYAELQMAETRSVNRLLRMDNALTPARLEEPQSWALCVPGSPA